MLTCISYDFVVWSLWDSVYVLSQGCERISCHGAFLALNRGYIHWSSGRLGQIEINLKNPSFCHAQMCCNSTNENREVQRLSTTRETRRAIATVKKATCECAAGYVLCLHYLLVYHYCFYTGNLPRVHMYRPFCMLLRQLHALSLSCKLQVLLQR